MSRWYEDFFWGVMRCTYVRKLKKRNNVEVAFHDEEPTPPFIFMGNHSHSDDPFMAGGFLNHAVNYMANIAGGTYLQRKLASLMGIYGKKKGAPDIASLRHTIELLKGGHSIGIFPEGDRSWDGETAEFIPGSISIAKKYKIPLRLARLQGNYLTFPRWANTRRRGKVKIDFYTISKEEIERTPLEELRSKVKSILYNNDIKNPLNQKVKFTGDDLASGIEHLLWICPACGRQDTIRGRGDDIHCDSCGKNWNLDGSLKIFPAGIQGEDLKDWADWQRKEIIKICKQKGETRLTETENIILSRLEGRKVINPQKGVIRLYPDYIEFCSEDKESFNMDIEKVAHYIDNFNRSFQFDFENKRYQILFNGKNALKWIDFLNYLKSRKQRRS